MHACTPHTAPLVRRCSTSMRKGGTVTALLVHACETQVHEHTGVAIIAIPCTNTPLLTMHRNRMGHASTLIHRTAVRALRHQDGLRPTWQTWV